jgi:hypothetical protein
MDTAVCPHCSAVTDIKAAFCEACGKALPAAAPSGPRIISGDALPTSAAGQELIGDELSKQTKRAANTLLAVGIIQLTCGALVVALLANAPGAAELDVTVLIAAQFIVAAMFFGLYFWARSAPLPASIVGLVVYCTLLVLNIVTAVSEAAQDGPPRGFGGLGIGWLDILIIVLLVQGIQAGLKHKKILSAQG